MKTLEQIRDDYAVKNGSPNWIEYLLFMIRAKTSAKRITLVIDEIAELYHAQFSEPVIKVDWVGFTENINTYVKTHNTISVDFLKQLWNGYAEFGEPVTDKVYFCTICKTNVVDAENGFDTCQDCLSEM